MALQEPDHSEKLDKRQKDIAVRNLAASIMLTLIEVDGQGYSCTDWIKMAEWALLASDRIYNADIEELKTKRAEAENHSCPKADD